MNRIDLFLAVHKGIRAELFETARLVARTDFAVLAEARAADLRVQRSFRFLEEHALHEDEQIFALVQPQAPVLCAELQSEHSRIDGQMLEVVRLLARVENASESERVVLGGRVHAQLWGFVSGYLRHMEREEGELNRALWAHFSDEQLGAVQGRIIGSIEPSRMNDWMGIILPELNESERSALLASAGGAA